MEPERSFPAQCDCPEPTSWLIPESGPPLCSLEVLLVFLPSLGVSPPCGASGGVVLWKAGQGIALMRSVCLFLSKKGHRKTFAKKSFWKDTRPGPFGEAAPTGGLGCQLAAEPAASASGGPVPLLPSPHPGAPPSLGPSCAFLFFRNRPGAGEDFLHPPLLCLPPSSAFLPVIRAPECWHRSWGSAMFLDPSTLLVAPSCLAFAHAVPLARDVLFSPPFSWLTPPFP